MHFESVHFMLTKNLEVDKLRIDVITFLIMIEVENNRYSISDGLF